MSFVDFFFLWCNIQSKIGYYILLECPFRLFWYGLLHSVCLLQYRKFWWYNSLYPLFLKNRMIFTLSFLMFSFDYVEVIYFPSLFFCIYIFDMNSWIPIFSLTFNCFCLYQILPELNNERAPLGWFLWYYDMPSSDIFKNDFLTCCHKNVSRFILCLPHLSPGICYFWPPGSF